MTESEFLEVLERTKAFIRASGKPTEIAIAFALFLDDEHFVATKRSLQADDFPGKWSVPTMSISDEDFEAIEEAGFKIPSPVAEKVVGKNRLPLESPAPLESDCRIVRLGLRDRGESLLLMCVAVLNYQGEIDLEHFHGPRGQSFRAMDTSEFLELSDPGMGTCASLLIQHLIDIQKISSTAWFLEIPPALSHLSRDEIQALGNERLWHLCANTYEIHRQGLSGSIANAATELLLDSHIQEYISERATACNHGLRVLDVGSGKGSRLGRWCGSQGIHADSFEPTSEEKQTDVAGTASGTLPDTKYDLVVVCNVLQWVEDPVKLLRTARERMSNRSSMLVAMPTPEFYRTGKWIGDPRDGIWAIDAPMRSLGRLDMIAHAVGPLILFRRTTADYIGIFSEAGLAVTGIRNLPPSDGSFPVSSQDNWMARHRFVPAFSVFELHLALPRHD